MARAGVVFLERVAGPNGVLLPKVTALKLGAGLSYVYHAEDSLPGTLGAEGAVTGYLEIVVDGSTVPGDLTVPGNLDVEGTANVDGATHLIGAVTLDNTLSVAGSTTLAGLTANGSVNVNANLAAQAILVNTGSGSGTINIDQNGSIYYGTIALARLVSGATWTIGSDPGSGNFTTIINSRTSTKIQARSTTKIEVDSTGLGFYGAATVAQASRAGQLTDSTTGTPGAMVADGGVVYSQATTNNNNASLVQRINALELALHNLGVTA